jgi:hypothetical protein
MLNAPARTVFDVITDFLASEPTPQQIIDYSLPDDLQARADELAERNGEDLLTPSELEEMDEYIKANRMFSLLKTKMRVKLHQQS